MDALTILAGRVVTLPNTAVPMNSKVQGDVKQASRRNQSTNASLIKCSSSMFLVHFCYFWTRLVKYSAFLVKGKTSIKSTWVHGLNLNSCYFTQMLEKSKFVCVAILCSYSRKAINCIITSTDCMMSPTV